MAIPLRSMCSIYLCRGDSILLLHRKGSRVVNNVWIGSAAAIWSRMKSAVRKPVLCAKCRRNWALRRMTSPLRSCVTSPCA